MPNPEPVPHETPDIVAERTEALRELFPEAFSEDRADGSPAIDFDKLRAALGDLPADGTSADGQPERYSFSWAGKTQAIRILQAPSRATLVPAPEQSLDFDTTSNLFIEGDNLEVLKLLYKPYFGRVKMIYIDPPYNTGNDFVYPDNYADPLSTYLQMTGQRDAEGNLQTTNPETSGRYHSAWLSMMYPRLFLARQLLRDDGVIFVSIDDHEVHNLRMLMNEVFGEENLVVCMVWKRRQVADNRNINQVSVDHEYVVAYSRGTATFTGVHKDLTKYANPDNDARGPWMSDNMTGLATREQRPNLHYDLVDPETGHTYPAHPTRGWIYEPRTMQRLISERKVLWPSDPNGRPRLKRFLNEIRSRFTGFSSVQSVGYTTDGSREMVELIGDKALPFPKPSALIRVLCEQTTPPEEGDIILDFFAGSCTTAQAVLELNREDGGNRRFIMVQLPEPTGKPDFPTIADIGKERIRRVVARMKEADTGKLDIAERDTPEDLGFRVFKLAESNLQQWQDVPTDDPEAMREAMDRQLEPLRDGWTEEAVTAEIALREGFNLNYRVELLPPCPPPSQGGGNGNTVYRITDLDKEQTLLVCLDERVADITRQILHLAEDDLFVCRDRALTDTQAANLGLQCRLHTI